MEARLLSVFLNYRRNDAEGEAGRLFDDLSLHFSQNAIFMDVAAIEPGRDFRKAIDHSVASCSVLLAMIGPTWLDLQDAVGQRRLDDQNDFVRIELASALRRDIPVVPILVRGAKMPRAEQLPDDLKELAYRNAVELTHARWKSDVQLLIQSIRRYVESPDASAHKVDNASGDPITKQPDHSPSKHLSPAIGEAASGSAISQQTIERVSRELAVYIGPAAEVLVKRAAKRCLSADDLCTLLAREIEGEGDRTKFLRSCRS